MLILLMTEHDDVTLHARATDVAGGVDGVVVDSVTRRVAQTQFLILVDREACRLQLREVCACVRLHRETLGDQRTL